MQFLRTVGWEQVFNVWRQQESGQKWGWDAVISDHGFDNWDDWRMSYVERMIPDLFDTADWNLYSIENPEQTCPQFYVGAFKGWRQFYPSGERVTQFRDLKNVEQNLKVTEVYDSFPSNTQIIGLEHQDDIMILEGTHRCVALSLAAKRGEKISRDVTIATLSVDKDTFKKATTQEID